MNKEDNITPITTPSARMASPGPLIAKAEIPDVDPTVCRQQAFAQGDQTI
jgi:hypothetical protein